MVTLENIIKSLNIHIEGIRRNRSLGSNCGRLVLHKQIETNTKFPIYKELVARVWYCKKGKSYPLFISQVTDKISSGQEDKYWELISTSLLDQIFNWIGTEGYNQVIEGTYEG